MNISDSCHNHDYGINSGKVFTTTMGLLIEIPALINLVNTHFKLRDKLYR